MYNCVCVIELYRIYIKQHTHNKSKLFSRTSIVMLSKKAEAKNHFDFQTVVSF